MLYASEGITLEWSTIAGSGFVVGVAFLALVERLRRTFATRQELNGMGKRFNAMETLYVQLRDAVDEARDQALEMRAEQRNQAERIGRVVEQMTRPLERATEKLEALGGVQASQSTTLEHLERRLARVEECITPGAANPASRRKT